MNNNDDQQKMTREKLFEIVSSEIHKPVKRKFKRRKIITFGLDHIWAADLVDMKEWSNDNNGYKYILTVVDLLSRYAWTKPLKSKTAKEVKQAFEEIFLDSKTSPNKLYIDKGGEFHNIEMSKLLKQHNISVYSTFSEFKVSPIETFNKTLKHMMWRYFTKNNTRKWFDVIDKLVDKYNKSIHKSIGMSPKQARNKKYEEMLVNNQFVFYGPPNRKPKFKVGDFVRLSRIKGKFEKGYHPNWTLQVYQISKVRKSDPPTYNVVDLTGEPVIGSFYEEELQKTKQKDYGLVEKVIKTRTYRGKKQAYVKWLGLDSKYNSWIDYDKDIIE